MSLLWPRDEPPAIEALEFLQPSPLVMPCQALTDLAATLPAADRSLAALLDDLVNLVRARLVYETKVTSTRTSITEVLRLGRGVCQDFSHLFLGLCRHLGLPARYVSGYIHHPGEMATHAWCQVWGGAGTGWIDIDPTSGDIVSDDHVVVAIGRDYADVTPNRGVWKGQAREDIEVVVTIEPVERVPMEWPDTTLAGRPRPSNGGPSPRRANLSAGARASFVA
jgi:transglutaminase-like putative cysteine protease